MRRKYFVHTLLGLVLGGGLLWLLIRQTALSWVDVAALVERLQLLPALGIVALTLLLLETGARKWAYIDRVMDKKPPRPHQFYWRHSLWQVWLAQILPSPVAMIAGRAAVTHQTEGKNWRRGVRSGLVDQLGDLLAVLCFIPASLWQLYAQGDFVPWLMVGVAAYLLVALLGLRLVPAYFHPVLLVFSLLRFLIIIGRLVLGAAVFGLALAGDSIAYATPLATLTVLLPLTPGNLGLTEWGWNYALGLWHADPATILLYLLSFRLLMLTLHSALLLLLPRWRAR